MVISIEEKKGNRKRGMGRLEKDERGDAISFGNKVIES
jgi:hypothetical protein